MGVSPQATTLTVSWTQPQGEVVDNYDISLDYLGPCPDFNPDVQAGELPSERTDVTFGGTEPLQEFSDYQFTITARNGAGQSPTVTVNVTTEPAGRPLRGRGVCCHGTPHSSWHWSAGTDGDLHELKLCDHPVGQSEVCGQEQ